MKNSKLSIDFKYLIANDYDEKMGLTINNIGFQTVQFDSVCPLEGHPADYNFQISKGRVLNEYQFIYITEGSGVLQLELGISIPISKGQVIVIFPGQWHSYYPTKEVGWNEYYIGFSGEIVDKLVQNSFITKENQLMNVGLNEELVSLYKRAIEIARADKTATQQHLFGIVMHMIGLILFESNSTGTVDTKSKQMVEKAKIAMVENVFTDMRVEDLCIKLNINYTTFRKIFKIITGFAPAQYFHALKIQKAKQLLLESEYSVKEIAYMLSFYSPESFNTTFKKCTGQCPSKYRCVSRKTTY